MSLNLHQIARGAITMVNSDETGSILRSTGSVTIPGGLRTATYQRTNGVKMNVQPLSMQDVGRLEKMDGLNIEGVVRAAYINGDVRGVDRVQKKGGDMVYVLGFWWLVVAVLEPWDSAGWTKVALQQQVRAPDGA